MKTYLFDFDGTLVDSMPTFASVMTRILDENGIKYGEDIVKIITPLGYAGTAKYFIELGIEKTMEELIKTMNDYAKVEYELTIPEKKGVSNTLRKLKSEGASLNILTASPHSMLDPCLKRLGIFDIFDNVWSSDDFGTTKANPEIYKMAAERIGTPVEKIIFVDDNIGALKSAKASGIITCGIYDESSKDYINDIKALADHYVTNFEELTEL